MHLSVSSLQSIFRPRSSQQKFKLGGPQNFVGRWEPHQKKDLHHELIKYLAGMSSIQIIAVQGCCFAVSGSNTPQRPCYEKLPPFSFLRTKVETKELWGSWWSPRGGSYLGENKPTTHRFITDSGFGMTVKQWRQRRSYSFTDIRVLNSETSLSCTTAAS